MNNYEHVNDDIIEELVKRDAPFMYKLHLIKEKMLSNLNDYGDSIGEFGNMFSNVEREMGVITNSFSDVTGSLNKLSDRLNNIANNISLDELSLNVNGDMYHSDEMLSKLDILTDAVYQLNIGKSDGIFEQDAQEVIITGMSDNVYSRLLDIEKSSITSDGKISKIKSGGLFSGIFGKGMLGGIKGSSIFKGIMTMKVIKMFKGGVGSKVATRLGPGAGPMAILAGGIIWTAMDGIAGWFDSSDNDSSKTANAIGGIYTSSSWQKNAVKFGLVGAGAGMTFGPIGIVAGSILGAAMGSIMQLIGAENIEEDVDSMWKGIKDYFSKEGSDNRKLARTASALRTKTKSDDTSDKAIEWFLKSHGIRNVNPNDVKWLQSLGLDLLDPATIDLLKRYEDENIQDSIDGLNIMSLQDSFARLGKKQSKIAIENLRNVMANEPPPEVQIVEVSNGDEYVKSVKQLEKLEKELRVLNDNGEVTIGVLKQINKAQQNMNASMVYKVDMGGIRESAVDAAYDMRKACHARGNN